MKMKRRLAAAALAVSMLLSSFGGGIVSAAAAQSVTTDSELAYDPLVQTASIAYEQHEDGYSVTLDRTADSATMNITAVPGAESSRTAEKARLYIRTGVDLKPGTTYRVGFSLSAEYEQPEYAVCFDGGDVPSAYGTLGGRSIRAGGTDQVKYQITPTAASGELVLRLLLGKTAGNTFRFSGLTVEEASGNAVGQDVVVVDNLDYSAPGFLRLWTNDDCKAILTSGGDSATLTVTQAPAEADAEVWKIKLLMATGLHPEAGKTYRVSADLRCSSEREFEVCYNEGETEKGYDVLYSQRLSKKIQTLDRRIYIPTDRENPGELILQLSLGKLHKGDAVTVSNVRVEESIAEYTNEMAGNFSYDTTYTVPDSYELAGFTMPGDPINVDWMTGATVKKTGDDAGDLTIKGGSATLEVKESADPVVYRARLDIDTGETLEAGENYLVSFKIKADKDYGKYEALYGTGLNGDGDNNQTYQGLWTLSLNAGEEETVNYPITPDETGGLLVSLQLGETDGSGNRVTVRDFNIKKIGFSDTFIDEDGNMATVNYPSGEVTPPEETDDWVKIDTPEGEPDRYYKASSNPPAGYEYAASMDGDAVKLDVTAVDSDPQVFKSKLYIRTGVTPAPGKEYEVSFDIKGLYAQNDWEINYGKGADNKGYGAVYQADTPNLSANGTETVTKTIPMTNAESVTSDNGELWIILGLGKAENTYWISNIKVDETGGSQEPDPWEGMSYQKKDDGSNSSTAERDGDAVKFTVSAVDSSPAVYKSKLCINTGLTPAPGKKYEVSFDIKGLKAQNDWEINYGNGGDNKGCGAVYEAATPNLSENQVVTVTQTIPLENAESVTGGDDKLWIILGLGKAENTYWISNIKVQEAGESSEPDPWEGITYDTRDFGGNSSEAEMDGDELKVVVSSASESFNSKLYIKTGVTLENNQKYNVSFDIRGSDSQSAWEINYGNGYSDDENNGKFYGATYQGDLSEIPATSTPLSVEKTIDAKADGNKELWITLCLGKSENTYWISNVKVEQVKPMGASANETAPLMQHSFGSFLNREEGPVFGASEAGIASLMKRGPRFFIGAEGRAFAAAKESSTSFRVRDGVPYSGTLTGDGSSAVFTCTGDSAPDTGTWERGLFADNICGLSAGSKYLVSFDIAASVETRYDVCYNKGDQEKGFGAEYGLSTTDRPTVEYPITASADGMLCLRFDLGSAANDTVVTISNIRVREYESDVESTTALSAFNTVWSETPIAEYQAELERSPDSATLHVTQAPPNTDEDRWRDFNTKLFIRTGMTPMDNTAYRVKFKIKATKPQARFHVLYSGDTDDKSYDGKYEISLAANQEKTIVHDIPEGKSDGELVLQFLLGWIDHTDGNSFTVSDITVEPISSQKTPTGIRTEGSATFDAQDGYGAMMIRNRDSATLDIKKTPSKDAEAWKLKMFLDPDVWLRDNKAYRVSFDVRAEKDADFEICYNRGDSEKGYDAIFGVHAEGGKVKTIEKVFTASARGSLKIQLSLGMVKAQNKITVSNIKVERIDYTDAGRSALPTAVNYQPPSSISYWAHEDYTTTLTGSANEITAHITAPQKGAEPWKVKLFVDTGAVLQAGKFYKVTASLSAKNSQDYEICYNNGGIENGYDSLGGLQLAGGKPQTVEKIIAVPAGKADTGNLMLQFNLGKTSADNAVSVSGVKVEEISVSYVDMMPKDFAYSAGRGVSVWTYTDYAANLESAGSAATLHITGVPDTGAEVWKTKLLVNTGAVLSAGKTYLVRANLLAAKGQGYEVCFNNEETEKGFDALYNQTIAAGIPTTLEKQISVPASMTDAGELILQFSVGGPEANDITVSGVSVQEVNFGSNGGGNLAPNTVVSLYNAPQAAAGTLDVTRGKLTCKMTKLPASAEDHAIKITGADLCAGELYTVSFKARANKNLTGTFALSQANGGASAISENFKLTTEETTYTFTAKGQLEKGGAYDLVWRLGSADNQKLGSADVEIYGISVSSPSEKLSITHGAQKVTVNGKAAAPDTYSINGGTYIKLRDLAKLLDNTDAQFVIRYNKTSNLLSLTTGKPYAPAGGELEAAADQSATCVRGARNIAVNGKAVKLKNYIIGGNYYFRLSDLDDLLGFQYTVDNSTVAIVSPPTPEAQEKAHSYDIFFLPEIDGEAQPYVGDTMPYYENGVYYIYYLKDGGDSYNHSVYLATTTDFVHYTELDNPVLSASREDVQDNWIGTGSVVKADGVYYLFYTGFTTSPTHEYREKIMVAQGSSPTSFEKVKGWEIIPPDELGQKNDFRDPQAYYDPASKTISLTVTSTQDGAARILKYTLGKDLRNVKYNGIIFTDPTGEFWNLECSDTFRLGNKWYLTYSGQEDTLWYAVADERFGPYTDAARLDGKLFYAGKHVEDGKNSYMVGWARRANSASSTQEVAGWAGNVAVQKLRQNPDGTLALVPVDSIVSSFGTSKALALSTAEATLTAGPGYSYQKAFTSCESFLLSGEFTYSGTGSFGLAFDFNGKEEQYKLISLDPMANKLKLSFNEGTTPITETQATLRPNEKHSFTYIQDGSIGIFYLDGQASLLVRLYGVTDKPIYLFAENNSVTFTSLRQYTP